MRALPVTDRFPAPDLARGAALLLIAVANAHTFVTHRGIGVRTYPWDLSGVDAAVAAVQLTLVDGRGYPLFALLFGFGVATLAARRTPPGGPAGDAVLAIVRRRGGALLAIGVAHAVLLWHGDIVGAYGLIAVLLAGLLVRAGTTALVTTAAGTIALTVLLYAPVALTRSGAPSASPSLVEPDPLDAAAGRFGEWMFGNLPVGALALTGAAVLGVLLARSGWLADPVRYRVPLARLAVAGTAAGVLGGLPLGLVAAGVWAPPTPVLLLVGPLHTLTGYAAGAGYAALAGLVVARWVDRGGPGPVGRALVETGRRSLSAYLAQSVAFVALFPAWTLGLGAGLPLWAATLCGAGVWLTTVLVATWSARSGLRGPAETLLRRLTYGTPALPRHAHETWARSRDPASVARFGERSRLGWVSERDGQGDDDGEERPPSWQGAPGYSGFDPERFPPHAPMPGAPPYPPGTEPERAEVDDRDPGPPSAGAVLPRCLAASAGWAVVALLLALVTGVSSWPLRGIALLVPWGLTAAALIVPARRGAGPGGLVALAFGPFWLLHALAVGLLGW